LSWAMVQVDLKRFKKLLQSQESNLIYKHT
jgi:hypothetical protein